MRTVYATVLEVRDSNDAASALEMVGTWITEWYAVSEVDVNQSVQTIFGADASQASGQAASTSEVELTPMPGHRLSIQWRSAQTHPGETLMDLVWSYPDQYDATLGWQVHLAVLMREGRLQLTMEVCVIGLSFLVAPAHFKPGSPRVIRDICRLGSVYLANRPYNRIPIVSQAQNVENLVAELLLPARSHPIVVVSRRNNAAGALVDAGQLAETLAGVAKVYELADRWAAFKLEEDLTHELACYDGAVRIYWPGLTKDADPYRHPLWLPAGLNTAEGAARGVQQLRGAVFGAASFRFAPPQAITALRREADREHREAVSKAALKEAGAEAMLESYYALEEKLKQANAEMDAMRDELETLRSNASALGAWNAPPIYGAVPAGPATQGAAGNDRVYDVEPAARAGEGGDDKVTTVAEAVRRATESAKHLIFLPAALESAEDSPFRKPKRVLEALEAIDIVAGQWIESLTSNKPVGSLREQFRLKGFAYADDVSATSAGKWPEQYVASHEGRSYDIAPHITIGARQADTCLSIHWAWDKDERKAVIAHVGRHKTNTSS